MSYHLVTENKNYQKHTEGDVWEEKGKTWTIKNGIKRTVNKMEETRKTFITPIACPKCQRSMNHYLNEQMWSIHKMCFNCVIDMEHEIMKAGKWDEYEKGKILANAEAMYKELAAQVEDFLKDSVSKSNVTEDGIVENWKDAGSDFLQSVADKELREFREKIDNYKDDKA
jgi:Zn ribbon nucleic-acid-binding protein